MKKILGFLLLILTTPLFSKTINVYGPAGPNYPLKEVGEKFFEKTGVMVNVVGGPTDRWAAEALKNADLIYSGSESMMDVLADQFGLEYSKPVYLRNAGILVRKGNPKKIKGIYSLMAKDMNIMVVDGSGQVSLWEDIVGRTKNINNIIGFRDNLVFVAKNNVEAFEIWNDDPSIDALIIWSHWYMKTKEVSDLVSIEPDLSIYRPLSIGLTKKATSSQIAQDFYDYLDSKEAIEIFKKHGFQKAW
ncbi:MAG: substrate-binding domain-containing protein [Brevinema sp.]